MTVILDENFYFNLILEAVRKGHLKVKNVDGVDMLQITLKGRKFLHFNDLEEMRKRGVKIDG